MSRGTARTARPVAVWLAVSAVALASASAVPAAWQASTDRAARPGAEVELLVAVCATGLAVSLTWLWVITTATVAGVLVGSGRPATPRGATRRWVLLACGVAVVAGTGAPALAADGNGDGDGTTLLAGLPLPERAVAPAAEAARQPEPRPVARPAPTAARTYVVRRGDSLWSIADSHPEPGTSASVEERWQAIWRANHDVVGDDPDLILPGQALRLPGPHHPDRRQPRAPKDGDR